MACTSTCIACRECDRAPKINSHRTAKICSYLNLLTTQNFSFYSNYDSNCYTMTCFIHYEIVPTTFARTFFWSDSNIGCLIIIIWRSVIMRRQSTWTTSRCLGFVGQKELKSFFFAPPCLRPTVPPSLIPPPPMLQPIRWVHITKHTQSLW